MLWRSLHRWGHSGSDFWLRGKYLAWGLLGAWICNSRSPLWDEGTRTGIACLAWEGVRKDCKSLAWTREAGLGMADRILRGNWAQHLMMTSRKDCSGGELLNCEGPWQLPGFCTPLTLRLLSQLSPLQMWVAPAKEVAKRRSSARKRKERTIQFYQQRKNM